MSAEELSKTPEPAALKESAHAAQRLRLPLAIPVEPYLRDHRFAGRVILSAVEILQRLAVSLQVHRPGAPVRRMRSASFDRFLQIEDDCAVIEACHDLESLADGSIRSRLTTTGALPGKSIRRTRIHAVVDFSEPARGADPPPDAAAFLDGVAFEVAPGRIYEAHVPFGPAYRSLTGLSVAESGALGRLRAPEIRFAALPLGSPFPFDGAMHAACVWGQLYRRITAFPVGFEERTVYIPTKPGESYICRVVPPAAESETLRFDIRIGSPDGTLHEYIKGLAMKDVSGRTR